MFSPAHTPPAGSRTLERVAKKHPSIRRPRGAVTGGSGATGVGGPGPDAAEMARQAAEDGRCAAEARREAQEALRDRAEAGRAIDERARAAAEEIRHAVVESVRLTAASLVAALDRMRAAEGLRRARWARPPDDPE